MPRGKGGLLPSKCNTFKLYIIFVPGACAYVYAKAIILYIIYHVYYICVCHCACACACAYVYGCVGVGACGGVLRRKDGWQGEATEDELAEGITKQR